MSWLFSQALVEVFLEDTSLDGEQSAPLSGSNIQQAYCAPDKMTDFSRFSRYGMTYKPLTESRGEELLTLYLEAFHAKTSAQQGKAQELTENAAGCGEKWHASFAKYSPDLFLWKTPQCSLLGDSEEFLETWPQWGLMRNGECWEQRTLEQTIRGTESGLLLPTPCATDAGSGRMNTSLGSSNQRPMLALMARKNLWPTPTANMHKGSSPAVIRKNGKDRSWDSLHYAVEQVTDVGGKLNPTWVEWMMGWPLGWTDLKPLEMDKSHCVPQQLGKS